MRKKSGMQNNGGYNNKKHRPGSGGGNNNRPRKNYAAAREKYLAQARDALAAGDRVLAENFFQHADHCYRMMVEEGYHVRQQHQNTHQPQAEEAASDVVEELIPGNTSQLPAFLTASYQGGQPAAAAAAVEANPAPDWDE